MQLIIFLSNIFFLAALHIFGVNGKNKQKHSKTFCFFHLYTSICEGLNGLNRFCRNILIIGWKLKTKQLGLYFNSWIRAFEGMNVISVDFYIIELFGWTKSTNLLYIKSYNFNNNCYEFQINSNDCYSKFISLIKPVHPNQTHQSKSNSSIQT